MKGFELRTGIILLGWMLMMSRMPESAYEGTSMSFMEANHI